MSRKKNPPARQLTASEQMDRELASRALDKRRTGQEPTAQELSALRRVEKAREDELRWEYYRSIPQKHWRQMSGRQAKVINEQASRYGLPFDGPRVDLPAVVKAIHDLLATKGRKLLDDSGELEQSASPMVELKRREDYLIRRMERMQLEGQVIPRVVVRKCFSQIASLLRRSVDLLERQFGPDAHRLMDEALLAAERLIIDGFSDVPIEEDDAGREGGAALAPPQQPEAAPPVDS